jgi:hypothetical protein
MFSTESHLSKSRFADELDDNPSSSLLRIALPIAQEEERSVQENGKIKQDRK